MNDAKTETACAPYGGSGTEIKPTLTESLKAQRHKLATELSNLDETIALIESQPEIQKVLDALTKLGRLNRF